ncbi:MAG TPA: SDR family NAD(P)-dependent oxidoreductase [Polyangiales bacterium]|nr:SDR family NAD(P)-dependent oxidoreductase [Polyangiales bacterium]
MNKSIALVTGASSGFGWVTAQRLHAAGHRVFGSSRSGRGGPAGVEMLQLDVTRQDSVARCIDSIGPLDILVNNAGVALSGACEETSVEEAQGLFETNLFGVMRVTSAVLPGMRARGRGRIVNVGSLSGAISVPFHGVYAASKHALAGYSDALRHELRPFGIRVSLVEPAAHRTSIQMALPASQLSVYDGPRARVIAIIQRQVARGADPARVAEVILRAATVAEPSARYRVGRKATLASVALWALPRAWLERFVRREFQLGEGFACS